MTVSCMTRSDKQHSIVVSTNDKSQNIKLASLETLLFQDSSSIHQME